MSDTHYGLVVEGLGVYARGTHDECSRAMEMHKRVKSGARKETAISLKAMSVQIQQGPYPDPNVKPLVLGYKPGK